MRKSSKSLLKAALVMGVIGSGFCIAGLCLGFTIGGFSQAVEAGSFQLIGPSGLQETVNGVVTDVVSENIDYEQTFRDVDALDLDLGVADCMVYVHEGEDWKVTGYNLPARFKCRLNGDTLQIDCEQSSWRFWESNHNAVLELYVPESAVLEKIDIDSGVGNIETEEGILRCEELDLDCGVGDCDLRMDILEKLDVDGGVGNVTLVLSGRQDDFDYDVDCGIGEIRIGELLISGLGGEQQINNDADKKIMVDCGVGSVDIAFEL